jgi:hypothetical protein
MQGQLHFGDYIKCYFDLSEEIKKQANRARICKILRGLGINSGLHRLAESIPGLLKIRALVVGEYLNRRQRPGDFHESFGKKTCDLMQLWFSHGFSCPIVTRWGVPEYSISLKVIILCFSSDRQRMSF